MDTGVNNDDWLTALLKEYEQEPKSEQATAENIEKLLNFLKIKKMKTIKIKTQEIETKEGLTKVYDLPETYLREIPCTYEYHQLCSALQDCESEEQFDSLKEDIKKIEDDFKQQYCECLLIDKNTGKHLEKGFIKKQIIINKTPHSVNIINQNNEIVKTYEKGISLIRLAVKTVRDVTLADGTPTTQTVFGKAEGLPDFQEGTFFIVSQLVKNALPDRADLLVPAEVVRDENGHIIGCKSLGR